MTVGPGVAGAIRHRLNWSQTVAKACADEIDLFRGSELDDMTSSLPAWWLDCFGLSSRRLQAPSLNLMGKVLGVGQHTRPPTVHRPRVAKQRRSTAERLDAEAISTLWPHTQAIRPYPTLNACFRSPFS